MRLSLWQYWQSRCWMHFTWCTQSTTSVTTVLMMTFRKSQCTRLIMPSTAFRWGKMHMVSLCALLLMLCILYNTVSSCTALNHSRKYKQWIVAKLDGMAFDFDKTCRQAVQSSFPLTDFLHGLTNLSQIECSEEPDSLFLLAALALQIERRHLLESNSQTWRLFWEQWNAFCVSRLGWISSNPWHHKTFGVFVHAQHSWVVSEVH